MRVLKAYKFRIYPTEEQRRFFIETFGCVRFTYNTLLMQRSEGEKGKKVEKLTPASLKKEYPFLKQVDSLALANAQLNLERAFRNYYQGRAGYPRLKKKQSSWQSYTTNNQDHTIYLQDQQLKLPKLKTRVAIDLHRPIAGTIKSATVSAKNNQVFFVSILCVEQMAPLAKTNQQISIEFSPKFLVTTTNQQTVLDKVPKTTLEEKIAKAEKKLALRAKCAKKRQVHLTDAKNYQKQKAKVAKLHNQQRYQLRAYMDEVSIELLRKYDQIQIGVFDEALPSDIFSKADWQAFLQKLRYKANWYQKELKFVSE